MREFCNFLITSVKIVGGIDVVENDEYMLQKDFVTFQCHLKGVFLEKFGDNEWLPPRRPTAWWYSDVTLALSSYLEAPQVALNEYFFYMTIVHYRSIYENLGTTSSNYETALENYKYLRNEKVLLVDCCQSLQYAEKQQTALEKHVRAASQSGSSTSEGQSFSSVFWKHPLNEDHNCYKAIADYAAEYYQRISPYLDRPTDNTTTGLYWDERIRRAMLEINRYPITTMLFPVLLTSYIVDPHEYQTIYPRMKYQKTKFPRNKRSDSIKDEMESLYHHLTGELEDLLCDLVPEETVKLPSKQKQIPRINALRIIDRLNKGRRTRCGLILPVVSPPSIAEKLSGIEPFENSSEYSNKEEIEQALRKCLSKNGRSYGEYQKDVKPSTETQIIYAIAKLCNANSYVYRRCGEILDHGVSSALNCLLQHGIISSSSQMVPSGKAYELQLYEQFCKEFSIYGENLSSLAFYKYFKPTLSNDILKEIPFFDELSKHVSTVIEEVSDEIHSDFGIPFQWSSDALTLGRKLSAQFCKKLAGEDIKAFISEIKHFKHEGFLQFLHKQCEQHKLDIMEKIPPELERQIIPLIFDDILRLVSASIVDLIRKYCNHELEMMLS